MTSIIESASGVSTLREAVIGRLRASSASASAYLNGCFKRQPPIRSAAGSTVGINQETDDDHRAPFRRTRLCRPWLAEELSQLLVRRLLRPEPHGFRQPAR